MKSEDGRRSGPNTGAPAEEFRLEAGDGELPQVLLHLCHAMQAGKAEICVRHGIATLIAANLRFLPLLQRTRRTRLPRRCRDISHDVVQIQLESLAEATFETDQGPLRLGAEWAETHHEQLDGQPIRSGPEHDPGIRLDGRLAMR